MGLAYSDIKIIPMPKQVKGKENFPAEIPVELFIHTEVQSWEKYLPAFIETVKKGHGVVFKKQKGGVEIVYNETLKRNEYTLKTTPNVRIEASNGEGVCYALATLVQLIEIKENKACVCECEIYDYPETDYRGVMAYVSAKRVLKFEDLLVFADLCYLYKMNYLHVHFTDSSSYALPSRVLPKLSSKGAYTWEQIEKLKEYCEQRNITIIPEIDLPGHAVAMVKNCPEKFANTYTVDFPYWEDGTPCAEEVICVGKDGAFETLERLIEEIALTFPDSPYIHIGGDEVNHRIWDACDDCRAYMKKHNIKNSNELYAHTIMRLANKVIAFGKRPIVWEGFSEEYVHLIPKECIIGVYESYYFLADKLIEHGFDIINCSWEPLYSVSWGAEMWWVDMQPWGYKEILDWDKYTFKNKYMKASPVHLKPMHLAPTNKVLGAQMCDWACYFAQKIGYIREFVPAVAERTWTVKRYCTDEQFLLKFIKTTRIFDELTEKRGLECDGEDVISSWKDGNTFIDMLAK